MSFTLDEIFTALKKKGFLQPNDEKKILVCEYDDSIRLTPPINSPIKQCDLAGICEQFEMSEAFFIDMVKCFKNREDYIRMLEEKRSNGR